MMVAKHLFLDCQRAGIQFFRLRVTLKGEMEPCQIAEVLRDIGVFWPQHLFADCQCLFQVCGRLSVLATLRIKVSQAVERQR